MGYKGYTLNKISKKIKKGVGIDIKISKKTSSENVTLIQGNLESRLKFANSSFDYVIMLALIEHIDKRKDLLKESYRVLKKGGCLLLTTPSLKSKKILETLAFQLNLLSPEEIKDHKYYYTKDTIRQDLASTGFRKKDVDIRCFMLGYNIYAKAKKKIVWF